MVSSFNNENDHCIEAHVFDLFMLLMASVVPLLTPQNKHFVSSFIQEKDQCIKVHFFFWLQYFDNLPLKIATLVWSINKKNNQCIKPHVLLFCMFLSTSVVRQFTSKNKHLVSSFNEEKWSVHQGTCCLFCLCFFWLQYFDRLPSK